MTRPLTVSDFDYALPPELIAQHPADQRGASRLLHLDGQSQLHDRAFADLASLMRAGDLLVFNDTRVIKARLTGHKASGGKTEVLIERITDTDRAWAHVRASKSPGPGTRLILGQNADGTGGFEATVLGRDGGLFDLRFPAPVLDLLEAHGATPLPPYITHAAASEDDERYQTVYARAPGAVAAPTAGLHFDQAMLARLGDAGVGRAFVTLHVGAGTFLPMRVEDVREHRMHSEWLNVGAELIAQIRRTRESGGRVIAVGTTVVRALESASVDGELHPFAGETQIFIFPGYRIRSVDAMVTNFHLSESTLLMLVSAFAGKERVLAAYAHAVQAQYRFFSYGDAMLLWGQADGEASPGR